jgi:hypothetical protein
VSIHAWSRATGCSTRPTPYGVTAC